MTTSTLIETLAWTLAHFVWQGVVLSLALAVGLRALQSAPARYAAATVTLASLVLAAVGTFAYLLPEHQKSNSVPLADTAKAANAAESGSIPNIPRNDEAFGNPWATSIAPASTPSKKSFPWQMWTVSVWLCGVALFGLRFLRDWQATWNLKRSAHALPDREAAKWKPRFEDLKRRMGAYQSVRLLVSFTNPIPMAIGVLRPVVIVPATMLTNLPPAHVEALLLHELAHIRRQDYLVNLLQSLAETLFFFHPATWWISSVIRAERENSCDDLAAARCHDVRTYAGALTALEQSRTNAGTALGMAAHGTRSGCLLARIRRLIRKQDSTNQSAMGWPSILLGASVMLTCTVAFTMIAQADDDEPQADEISLDGGALVIEITKGRITMNGKAVQEADIAKHVRAIQLESPPSEIKLRSGGNVPYSQIIGVLNELHAAGHHRVTFETSEKDAKSAATGTAAQTQLSGSNGVPITTWSNDIHGPLPFGPPNDHGLRVARLFDPLQKVYELGAQVDGRILFHNGGEQPVEFTTEDWHQRDSWHCHDQDGNKINPTIAERMGFRRWLTIKLEPGQVGEVAAQGTAIGTVPFDDEPGRVFWTAKIPAKPGAIRTCSWDVTFTPQGSNEEERLRSGKFTFLVKDRPKDFQVNLGVSHKLGKYHLAEGIKLQRSRGKETTATIEWKDGRRHALQLTHRDQADPLEPIVWWRGDSAFWIIAEDRLRKIDFDNPDDVRESAWPWDNVPEDFGKAPVPVREEIEQIRRGAEEESLSYENRPLAEWDEMLSGGGIRTEHRETLKLLGYGKVPSIPQDALPMILSLVETGKPATRCRCLGILRKVENPSDTILDTVLNALLEPGGGGNAFRAGYLLGRYPDRADYIVPRVLKLLETAPKANLPAIVLTCERLGPAARDALPTIEALRQNADERLMKAIDKTLASLQAK